MTARDFRRWLRARKRGPRASGDAGSSTAQRVPLLGRRVPAWAMVLLLLLSIALSAGVAVTVNNRSLSWLTGERVSVGVDLTQVFKGPDVVPSALTATGDTQAGAIEMAIATFPAARTALTAGNWKYVLELKEAAVGSIASGTFKAELFQDGASKGALFMKQVTADGAAVEGVTFSWDIGADLPSATGFKVEVTSV